MVLVLKVLKSSCTEELAHVVFEDVFSTEFMTTSGVDNLNENKAK